MGGGVMGRRAVRSSRSQFGSVDQLPSGRHRARYMGPDGQRHKAPQTFRIAAEAWAWLVREERLIADGAWVAPALRDRPRSDSGTTLAAYVAAWNGDQTWAPRTREHYTRYLQPIILGKFGARPVGGITRDEIVLWFKTVSPNSPTARKHVYQHFGTIMNAAVRDGLVESNPVQVPDVLNVKRKSVTHIATVEEISTITKAIREEWQAIVVMAGWMGLRFGEMIGLTRRDVDLVNREVHIRRGVVYLRPADEASRGKAKRIVGNTKSDAGFRVVPIPAHVVPVLEEHLEKHVRPGMDALLFHAVNDDSKHLSESTWHRHWAAARKAAGRPDLRLHDLRHTAGTRAAQHGATLKELMAFLGHSTSQAAMRYQHATQDRLRVIAERMAEEAMGR